MRNRTGLWLAVAAVLVSNGSALWHAWSNRSSAEREVVLTERELPRERQEQDNSGVSLRLGWGFLSGLRVDDWLDRSKLRELGFDVAMTPAGDAAKRGYSSMLARPVFVALEYDGPAWQKYLSDYDAWAKRWMFTNSAQMVQDQREGVRSGAGRLVPIDAARDAATLRARHPDASRVLIVGAKARVNYVADFRPTGRALTGRLEPLITLIHVPLPWSSQLANLGGGGYVGSTFRPRYEVHLRFGGKREPWVEKATMLQ